MPADGVALRQLLQIDPYSDVAPRSNVTNQKRQDVWLSEDQ
jgi:hypothetical protein